MANFSPKMVPYYLTMLAPTLATPHGKKRQHRKDEQATPAELWKAVGIREALAARNNSLAYS